MASFDTINKKLKEGTDYITGKGGALTSFFDSVKKIVPDSGYSASKPVKSSDGTVEIKAGEKSTKTSKSLPERLMNKKFFFPALIIGGLLFVVFRRLK